MDISETIDRDGPELKDSEHLGPFIRYLRPLCVDIAVGEVVEVYRTQDIVPIDEYGQMPRPKRRQLLQPNSIARKFTQDEVDKMSDRQRLKEIGQWGLSCNDSEESAIKAARYTYQRLKDRGASEEELEAYTHERGRHVVRLCITVETGMLTEYDDNGHANLFLYKGVDIEDSRDKDYDPVEINYKDYDNVD